MITFKPRSKWKNGRDHNYYHRLGNPHNLWYNHVTNKHGWSTCWSERTILCLVKKSWAIFKIDPTLWTFLLYYNGLLRNINKKCQMPDYYVCVHMHVHAKLVRSEYEKQPAAKKLSKHQPVISCYNNLEGQRPAEPGWPTSHIPLQPEILLILYCMMRASQGYGIRNG